MTVIEKNHGGNLQNGLSSDEQVVGFLNINKPAGVTTMDLVRRIKRESGQKRVGHGGTMDPFATGVVPICIGSATRMMEYLIEGTKEYQAVVELGTETDTYDSEGQVVGRKGHSSVSLEDIERRLVLFRGTIQQVPPMYSALKRQGKRLYDLARSGIQVERIPREVAVHRLDLLDWSPPHLTVQVTCGRGFYVRSLAHDLGYQLGCGGHLIALERLRSGPFEVADALTLEEASQRFVDGSWPDSLQPMDIVVLDLRAAVVGRRIEEMVRHGRPLSVGLGIPSSQPGERCRVYSVDGEFLAIIVFNASSGQWESDRVFPRSSY